jgi:hypothetical protein
MMGCVMKPDWILIANATRARLLQLDAESQLTILESFIHPAGRGRVGGVGDPGFAHELGCYLEQEARMDHFHTLSLFVAAAFMPELARELGKITQGMLCGTHEQDLTGLGPAELERCIRTELASEVN